MLKQWQKIENLINRILIKLMFLIKMGFLKITPKAFFRFRDRSVEKFHDLYFRMRDQSIHLFLEGKDRSAFYKERLFTGLENLQSYPYSQKLGELKDWIKQKLSQSPKQHLVEIKFLLNKIAHKISSVLNRFGQRHYFTAALSLAIIFLGSNAVINAGRFIWDHEFGGGKRAPASQEEVIKKPDYYNLDKRTFVVLNIRVPLTILDVKQIRSVTIDFGVKTSNRFTKLFLEENEHKIKDHFFMTVEPIESSFPIQPEGKNIIREKIHYELNQFLQAEGVEGSVEEVTILFIIAS